MPSMLCALVAGAAAVGKTCILQRYCGGHRGVINTEYEPTVVAGEK